MKLKVSAVCATVLVATGVQVATAEAAAAAELREITVVQPDRPANFLTDRILLAGNAGFLHRYAAQTGPTLWTRYADGSTAVIDDMPGASLNSWFPGGGDVVWAPDTTPGSLTALDLGTNTRRTYEAPTSGTFRLYGDTLFVRPATGPAGWALWKYAADGSHTTVPVTGVPADATGALVPRADSREVVLTITKPGGNRLGLLDLRTGAIALLPVDITGQPYVLLSAGHVAVRLCPQGGDLCQYRIFSRAGLRAGDTTARTVDVPRLLPDHRTLLVGDHLISAEETTQRPAVIDRGGSGTPVVAPMSQAGQQTFLGGDTGGLFVGGAAGDWGVRRLTAGPDGELVQVVVHDLTRGRDNAGLTLSHGLLRHIQSQQIDGDSTVRYHLFNHAITASGSTPVTHGGELTSPKPCQAGVKCVRSIDGHSWGTAYLSSGDSLHYRSVSSSESSIYVGPGAELRDASARWVLADSADGPTGYTFNPATVEERRTRPAGAAALWFDTIWSSPSAGTLRAAEAWSATATTMSTGATCVPDDLQAVQRYVHWSCGATGPAAVFDTARRVRIDLPPGRYLLGDNYVVRHDATTRRLLRYDLSGGTVGEPAVVATLPASEVADRRNITWAVDKYSGNIAHVDAAGAVHIVDPGVPRSAPVLGGTYHYNGTYIYFSAGRQFRGVWDLSRPVDAWNVTFARVSGGAVVATRSGGATASGISADWDGRLTSGEKAPSGRYRYSVDVTVNGTTSRIDSNYVTVECGPTPFRSYTCDGQVSLLGVFKSGEGHWLTVTNGAILDNGASESWYLNAGTSPVTTAIVPFGDLNRDGHNDLLARTSTGALVVHHGIGQPHFGGRVTKTIGTGWGGFRQIVTSGDLTGDGIPDVLAQDATGVLRRYNGTTAGGLANGAIVTGSWSHPKLIGPGDVTGDGHADLYAVNSAGQLDLFPGSGTGTFGTARRIGSGWAPYTLVGIGDTNEDLRNDLVARDSAGVFWLYPGDGAGGFGSRRQLGTGFQKYQGLY